MRTLTVVILLALLSNACNGNGSEEPVEIDRRTFRADAEAMWSLLLQDLDTSANQALGEAFEGERLSAEQFAKQFPEYADQIPDLLLAYPEFEKQGIPSSLFDSFAEFADDVGLPMLETGVERMRQLPRPQGDEESLEQLFDAFESGLQAIRADPVASLFADIDPLADAFENADAYGFLFEPSGWPPPTILSVQNAQGGE